MPEPYSSAPTGFNRQCSKNQPPLLCGQLGLALSQDCLRLWAEDASVRL